MCVTMGMSRLCWQARLALAKWMQVHHQFPENVEALRSLVQLATALHAPAKRDAYEQTLQKVERAIALRAEVPVATGTAQPRHSFASAGGWGTQPAPGSSHVADAMAQQQYQPEQGLGGGMDLLPDVEVYQPPASGAHVLVPTTGTKEVWDEQLGADLLPGLD